METNELLDLLARRLDDAQRAIERLADYAKEAGHPVRGNEARIVAQSCRAAAAAAAARAALPEPEPTGGPGYPGPCPDGMDWSRWLAMNNVD